MLAMSTAMQAAIRSSHTVAQKVELVSPTATVQLYVTDGDVAVDGNAAIRRRCSVTLTDPDGTLTPANASAALSPFGNELKLYRGVQLPTGPELMPLGVFVITQVTVNETSTGLSLTVEGMDRAIKIQRARHLTPYVIAAGTNYGTAIRDAISTRNPWATFDFQPVTQTTPQLLLGVTPDHDPWKEYQGMATSIGCDLYLSPTGVVTLRQVTTQSQAVWTYAEGSEAMLLGATRKLDAESTYNHVIVTGESANAAPVRGEAKDVAQGSPTNVTGAFGDVPYWFPSPLVTTTEQASLAAQTVLARVMGRQESLDFPAMVNPAHEAGDVIQVTSPGAKVSDLFILDSFNIPMSAKGTMKAVTRKRQVPA